MADDIPAKACKFFLTFTEVYVILPLFVRKAAMAQPVERRLGKAEVASSILAGSFIRQSAL